MRFAEFYPSTCPSTRTAPAAGFFEKNRPATFTHPIYSFMGDWVMWKDMLTGHIRF